VPSPSSLNSRGLASHLIGRSVLEASARLLGEHAIPVMPLKGIWLQQFVYSDPGERPITDVDVLVPDGLYTRAVAVLREAGWEWRAENIAETALRSPGWPLALDLHRALFARSGYRMSARELFERGHADDSAYGVQVISPDPRDVFAHLVGHFVKSRGGRDTSSHELRDLPAIAARFGLEPDATARHLEQCGLARASRYALRCVPDSFDPAGFCRATWAALAPDVIGQACADTMLALRERTTARSVWASLPGFVLEPSLPGGVVTAVMRVFDRAHEASDR
jgi:hypothetical protein